MISGIILFVFLISVLLGKYAFRKFFNHLSLYAFIWSVMILLYEWKLLPYTEIVPEAWFYIFTTFVCFLTGILTLIAARRVFQSANGNTVDFDSSLFIFTDGGVTVKKYLIIFSTISLLGALQHWYILINMFGSITEVFINAIKIYTMNTSGGGIEGQVPFISNFGYVSIFWGAIYTAQRGKFSFLTFYPFVGVIIKELSTLGRAGLLLALIEFLFAFILFRQMLSKDFKNRYSFSKPNGAFAVILLLAIIVVSASLVKISRVSYEQYQGASSTLKSTEGNPILSPSVYLYFSAHLGVLSKYFEKEEENTYFAQNTFLPVYNFLDKLNLVKRPSAYQKGYFIPMWVNTGTYIRELHEDFGTIGVFLIPYFLGILLTWLWFKFMESKNMYFLVLLVYFFIIIGFSFLVMITRTSYWIISMSLILLSIPVIENSVKRGLNRLNN